MTTKNELQKSVESAIQDFYNDGPLTEDDVELARSVLNALLNAMGRRSAVIYEVALLSPSTNSDGRRWVKVSFKTSDAKDVPRLIAMLKDRQGPGDVKVSELSTYTKDVTDAF